MNTVSQNWKKSLSRKLKIQEEKAKRKSQKYPSLRLNLVKLEESTSSDKEEPSNKRRSESNELSPRRRKEPSITSTQSLEECKAEVMIDLTQSSNSRDTEVIESSQSSKSKSEDGRKGRSVASTKSDCSQNEKPICWTQKPDETDLDAAPSVPKTLIGISQTDHDIKPVSGGLLESLNRAQAQRKTELELRNALTDSDIRVEIVQVAKKCAQFLLLCKAFKEKEELCFVLLDGDADALTLQVGKQLCIFAPFETIEPLPQNLHPVIVCPKLVVPKD